MTTVDDHAPQTTVFSVDVDPDGRRLALRGELDIATAPTLVGALDELLVRDTTTITVDFGGATFIDSSGMDVLADAHAILRAEGGRLQLRNLREAQRRALQFGLLSDLLQAG